MAWVEQLLSILNQRQADELRVAAGHEPRAFRRGEARALSIPKMSERDVRNLLGDLLTKDREEEAARAGGTKFDYASDANGMFHVVVKVEPELSATFTKAQPIASPASSVPSEAAPPMRPARPTHHEAAPVIVKTESDGRAISALLGQAARLRASDLHVAEGEAPRARIDGRLSPIGDGPLTNVTALLGLDDGERARLEQSGSLDVGVDVPGVGRVRVHVYSTYGGVAAAIRLLPPSAPSLAELGMPVPLDDLALLPHGLVLFCGPSGSGKSTTLAAIAQEALRRRSIVLVTLEDPIEYGLAMTDSSIVRRRQVGRDVTSFASGLRDALREDPDVLLVGEMRDPETIALALTAAETGHLVLASMHSRSAASAVQRIFDSTAPERQQQIKAQLADSLRAIVTGRLVPRLGRSGRIPVCEVLRGNAAVASTIREGKTAQLTSIAQSSRKDGMLSLERCLADRVRGGEISVEVARAAASDVSTLTLYLND